MSISAGRKDDMTLCSRCRRGRDISLHTNRPAFDTSSPEFNIVSSLFVCPEFDLASSKRTEMLGKSTTKVDQAKETTTDFHGISWGIPFILMSPRCWRSRTTWRPTWRICHRAPHRDPKQTPLVPHPSPQRQSLRRHLKSSLAPAPWVSHGEWFVRGQVPIENRYSMYICVCVYVSIYIYIYT